jgi:hypothetical protein
LYAEDEQLRFRAAKYLRNDKKGRLDRSEFKTLNINIAEFNALLQQGRDAMKKAKEARVVELQESN